jgi:hypothetical protein
LCSFLTIIRTPFPFQNFKFVQLWQTRGIILEVKREVGFVGEGITTGGLIDGEAVDIKEAMVQQGIMQTMMVMS